MKLQLWTDGSCKKNGKKGAIGGYAYVIVDEDVGIVDEFSAADHNTTNNRMELKAVIYGLRAVKSYVKSEFYEVEVYLDSAYIQNCFAQNWYKAWITNGWKTASKEPVKNQDLWEELIPYFNDIRYTFIKVKGHNGVKYNEIVDALAQEAAWKLEEINK